MLSSVGMSMDGLKLEDLIAETAILTAKSPMYADLVRMRYIRHLQRFWSGYRDGNSDPSGNSLENSSEEFEFSNMEVPEDGGVNVWK